MSTTITPLRAKSFTGFLHSALATLVHNVNDSKDAKNSKTCVMTFFIDPSRYEVDKQAREDIAHRAERKVNWKPAIVPDGTMVPIDETLIVPAFRTVRSIVVQLTFDRPSHDVIGGLVPTQIRAAGFNVYHFFTDFRFLPRYPDYVSQCYESIHLKYYAVELGRQAVARTPHPLKGIQRYVDTKTDPLYANMIKQIRLADIFAVEGDIYELNIDRPKLDGDESDESNDSEDDDGNKDPKEPPLTRITVDGDDAGARINVLAFLQ